MPGLNQTGPMGQGPMTGRRLGKCTNFGLGRKNSNPQNQFQSRNMNTLNESPERLHMRGSYGRGNGCRRGGNNETSSGLRIRHRFRGGN